MVAENGESSACCSTYAVSQGISSFQQLCAMLDAFLSDPSDRSNGWHYRKHPDGITSNLPIVACSYLFAGQCLPPEIPDRHRE